MTGPTGEPAGPAGNARSASSVPLAGYGSAPGSASRCAWCWRRGGHGKRPGSRVTCHAECLRCADLRRLERLAAGEEPGAWAPGERRSAYALRYRGLLTVSKSGGGCPRGGHRGRPVLPSAWLSSDAPACADDGVQVVSVRPSAPVKGAARREATGRKDSAASHSERPVARARRAKAQQLVDRLAAEGRVRFAEGSHPNARSQRPKAGAPAVRLLTQLSSLQLAVAAHRINEKVSACFQSCGQGFVQLSPGAVHPMGIDIELCERRLRRCHSAPAPDESAAVPGRAKTARITNVVNVVSESCGALWLSARPLVLRRCAGRTTESGLHRLSGAQPGWFLDTGDCCAGPVLLGFLGFLLLGGVWAAVSAVSLVSASKCV